MIIVKTVVISLFARAADLVIERFFKISVIKCYDNLHYEDEEDGEDDKQTWWWG